MGEELKESKVYFKTSEDDSEWNELKGIENVDINFKEPEYSDYIAKQIKSGTFLGEYDILGTTYKIFTDVPPDQDKKFESIDGYCDTSVKKIFIAELKPDNFSKEDLEYVKNKILRHEILHAFLYESGMDVNSNNVDSWGTNEEMVDWFAIQSPKILELYMILEII